MTALRSRAKKTLAAAASLALAFAMSSFAMSSFATDASGVAEAEFFEISPSAIAPRLGNAEVHAIAPFARFSRDSAPPTGDVPASAPARNEIPSVGPAANSVVSAANGDAAGVPVIAWRGEIVNFRFGVWAGATAIENLDFSRKFSLKNPGGSALGAVAVPVRWVRGDGDEQFADIVARDGEKIGVPAGTLREILVSVEVPRDAAPGVYEGIFSVELPENPSPSESSGTPSESSGAVVSAENFGGSRENFTGKTFRVAVRVVASSLPSVSERKIHLDLWQHPQAFARWAKVDAWSRAHFDAMVPAMRRLRGLGQKVVTCAIIEEPWSHQTFDDWPAMVKWTRERDGSWRFDYAAFDAWVSFMENEIGIDGQISCYSMLPWKMEISYFDVAAGEQRAFPLDVASPEFSEIWTAFLADFREHLRAKGWLEKTCIALDERPDEQLDAARKIVESVAPELKIVSANNHPTRMSEHVYDISPIFSHSGNGVPALAAARRVEGKKTTFYVCTSPVRPNTFTHSAPAEARWLGLYAAANGFDGFLRWAFNSWNENPFATTAFGNWPAGDCFLIYPGNRSSMRLENLRDGIEDFEKILTLRERAAEPDAAGTLKAAVAALDAFLKAEFTVEAGGGTAHEAQVLRAIQLLDEASLAADFSG